MLQAIGFFTSKFSGSSFLKKRKTDVVFKIDEFHGS